MTIVYLLLFSFFFPEDSYREIPFKEEPFLRTKILDSESSLSLHLNRTWSINGLQIAPSDSLFRIAAEENEIILYSADQKIMISADSLIFVSEDDSSTIEIKDVPYGKGWWWEGKEDRIYEGGIRIYVNAHHLQVIVQLPLEQYLKGVIPYEIGSDAPLEALKAQAVAARSEAIMALTSGMYSGDHYNLTADVECQVFSGNRKRNKITDLAVDQTRSIILTEDGKPINAYYASNCGGHSELIQNVWPDRPDPETYHIVGIDNLQKQNLDLSSEAKAREWILSEPNVFCNPALNRDLPSWSKSNFRWTKAFSADSLTRMLSNGQDFGLLKEIQVKKRGPSGRIIQACFIFEKDTLDVKGELNIRQLWKPSLRSACFIIEKDSSNFLIKGAGWGHGVGMCQSGAITMAAHDSSFESILKHYYPGSDLFPVYPAMN